MKNYEIQLVRKVGSNTYDFIKINSFESRGEWQSALQKLMSALCECNCGTFVHYQKVNNVHIAYAQIEAN